VGHTEGFAAGPFQEIAGNRFAGRIGHGVHQSVETVPTCGHRCHQVRNLGVVGDITGKDEAGAAFRCQVGNPILEALALVGERQFGPLSLTPAGNAVGDRPVRQQSQDQDPFA
jgi:hypothetical protein